MEYQNYIHNSSVVLNSEGSCTINCPGCNFGTKERKEINKLSIEDIKKRIDYAALNLSDGYSLILLPGNVLLEYDEKQMEEIISYACSKSPIVQWELEKIDERILNIFKNEKISELLRTKKLFLNIGYTAGNMNLLYKIYNELCLLGIDTIKEILIQRDLFDSFEELDFGKKLDKLKELENDGILPSGFELIDLGIHGGHGDKKRGELVSFLEKEGFNVDIQEIKNLEKNSGNMHFHSSESGVLITLHYTPIQKIDKYGNNIWKVEHEEGEGACLLINREFEWSIGGDKDGTILPHSNPCINKLSFGNLKSSKDDLDNAYKDHIDKIFGILVKYKYTENFNQSELCNKCLNGEAIDFNKKDYLNYKMRELTFKFKKICSKILFK